MPSIVASGCSRSSERDEVKKLREEVEQLKANRPELANQSPSHPQLSKEYDAFISTARRLLTSVDAGTTYVSFHDRVGEISASALEAEGATSDANKRQLIVDFSNAVTDANDLWRCKIHSEVDGIPLKRITGTYIHTAPFVNCGGRWDDHIQELIELYHLDTSYVDYSVEGGRLKFDSSLRIIFAFCSEKFKKLQDY